MSRLNLFLEFSAITLKTRRSLFHVYAITDFEWLTAAFKNRYQVVTSFDQNVYVHTAPGTCKSRFNMGYKRLAKRQVPSTKQSLYNSYEICTRDPHFRLSHYLRVGNLAGLIFIAQINKTVSLQENLLSSSKLRLLLFVLRCNRKLLFRKCFRLCLPRHQSLTTGFRNQATERTITQILNGAKNCIVLVCGRWSKLR